MYNLFRNPNTGKWITNESPIYHIDYSTTADTEYVRWLDSGTDKTVIMSVFDDGTEAIFTYAYDTWANRATATYSAFEDFEIGE